MMPFRDELSCHLDISGAHRPGFIIPEIDSAGDVFKRGVFRGKLLQEAFEMDGALERGLAVGDGFDLKSTCSINAFFF